MTSGIFLLFFCGRSLATPRSAPVPGRSNARQGGTVGTFQPASGSGRCCARDGHTPSPSPCKAFTVAARLAASPTFSICAFLSIRFMNPLSAVPGPSSMNRVNPCASNVRMDSSHRTGLVTCSTSRALMSAGPP